ncbi:MAG: twin-arginine translocase TatA/TatE family subunit [Oligoflexia bacterium]|nr:twin-arginine translocase TatA/TatE family subunit [Oligoflexia bacterium]
MGNLGMTELLLVGGIALLFFGSNRLPSLGQALGKTISNFKKELFEISNDEVVPKQPSEPKQIQISSRVKR